MYGITKIFGVTGKRLVHIDHEQVPRASDIVDNLKAHLKRPGQCGGRQAGVPLRIFLNFYALGPAPRGAARLFA